MRKKIIVVHGLPATGKSFFSRLLASEFQAVHINTDVVRDESDLRGKYDESSNTKVYDELMNRVEEELRLNDTVIADGTFHLQNIRERMLKLADDMHADLFFIEMKAMDDVVAGRLNKSRQYSEADLDAYRKIKAEYEENRQNKLVIWTDRNTAGEMIGKAKVYIYGE